MALEAPTVIALCVAGVSWTSATLLIGMWLTKQFTDVKDFVRSEFKEHSIEEAKKFKEITDELDILELRVLKVELVADVKTETIPQMKKVFKSQ